MKQLARFLSPSFFLIVLISFFLPFVSFTCQSQKIVTLTGIQLVTGAEIKQSNMFGSKNRIEKINSEPYAVVAFLSGIFAFVFSFVRGKGSSIISAIGAGVGFVFLLLLKFKLDNDALREGEGLIQVDYQIGYYMAFLFFILAILLNIFLFTQKQKDDAVDEQS